MQRPPGYFLFLTLLISSCFLRYACAQEQAYLSANKKEVTAAEYSDFLNRTAATDPHHLYDEKIGTDPEAACIKRVIRSGKFYYELIAGREDFPVRYVSEQAKDFFYQETESRVSEHGVSVDNKQEDSSLSDKGVERFLASNRDVFYEVLQNGPSLQLSLNDSVHEPANDVEIIGLAVLGALAITGDRIVLPGGETPPPAEVGLRLLPDSSIDQEQPHQHINTITPFAPHAPGIQLPDNELQVIKKLVPQSDHSGISKKRVHEMHYFPRELINIISLDKIDSLKKEKNRIEQDYKDLSLNATADPDHLQFLKNRKEILKAEVTYRGAMIERLNEYVASEHDPRMEALKWSHSIYNANKLAEGHSVKISKIDQQFKRNYELLAENKKTLATLELELSQNQDDSINIRKKISDLEREIVLLRFAMDSQASYAKLLPPLCKVMESEKPIEKKEWLSLAEEAERQSANLTAIVLDIKNKQEEYSYFIDHSYETTADCFKKIAHEAQKDSPNKQVISLFSESASLFQQAAEKNNLRYRMAADALLEAATEALNNQPNQDAISLFSESASLFQQATEIENLSCHPAAAGFALLQAATETQKTQPNQNAISLFCKSSLLFQEAAEKNNFAYYSKGYAFLQSGREILNDQPNQNAISLFHESASLFQQAEEKDSSRYFQAGTALLEAATEALKTQPNQDAICLFSESAFLFQQAEEKDSSRYFQAGTALFEAATEALNDQPNQNLIDSLITQSREHQRAAEEIEKEPTQKINCTIS
ncbi:MAG: hypothetical protein ACH346_03640 [Chthoniobacterales bacterium]